MVSPYTDIISTILQANTDNKTESKTNKQHVDNKKIKDEWDIKPLVLQ